MQSFVAKFHTLYYIVYIHGIMPIHNPRDYSHPEDGVHDTFYFGVGSEKRMTG
jgi:hypothetical protein